MKPRSDRSLQSNLWISQESKAERGTNFQLDSITTPSDVASLRKRELNEYTEASSSIPLYIHQDEPGRVSMYGVKENVTRIRSSLAAYPKRWAYLEKSLVSDNDLARLDGIRRRDTMQRRSSLMRKLRSAVDALRKRSSSTTSETQTSLDFSSSAAMSQEPNLEKNVPSTSSYRSTPKTQISRIIEPSSLKANPPKDSIAKVSAKPLKSSQSQFHPKSRSSSSLSLENPSNTDLSSDDLD